MIGPEGSPSEPVCHCGALQQQSWWQEILETRHYRVVRVEGVNDVACVLTISVSPESTARHPVFLTVADIDWPTLLAQFAEPMLTRNGEEAALVAHDMVLTKLRQVFTVADDPAYPGVRCEGVAGPAGVHL